MEFPKGGGVFRVSNYEFMRELQAGDPGYPNVAMIRIRVKQLISRPNGTYLAIPEKDHLGGLVQAKNEYVGEGMSESEALEACVAKIKDAEFSDIFPKRERRPTRNK